MIEPTFKFLGVFSSKTIAYFQPFFFSYFLQLHGPCPLQYLSYRVMFFNIAGNL